MTAPTAIDDLLNERLEKRRQDGLLRTLRALKIPEVITSNGGVLAPKVLVDFCSNDYLGFAQSAELKNLTAIELSKFPNYPNGSGGSRLLSGNTKYTEETEEFIANYHSAPAGLFFNSGYDANTGLLSSVPQRGDTIISDELNHASLIDGCRLSLAQRFKFKHNDLADLEKKLKIAKGSVFVVVESVYSMDGDLASLLEISSLCEKYTANLVVDEAHATGVFGRNGAGLVTELHLENKVFARIVTFGKAMGTHGAIVLGSNTLRQYLINFARSFIYTTAAPMHHVAAIKAAYLLLSQTSSKKLNQNIAVFQKLARACNLPILESNSTIQGVLFSTNNAAKSVATYLQKQGFDARAILSPTVPAGKERIRICIHQFNTEEEITALISNLKTTLND
ncbi:8-amino-7-oxononanoate synthase [Pedobacter sp. UYP30]|uniref:aminotransferase class I/II-fold pyridoxal phosphate-dependent enzyme n=1 Tax=Pedobacter sp. UYP30 TaxID=1756400 RepID=UPI00339910C1